MGLINDVDRPGSDIENYVVSLDKLLADKVEKINSIRLRLNKFHVLLKDEEALSTKFTNNTDVLDLYDLNNKNFDNIEDDFDEEFRDDISPNNVMRK
jgi:hypothetical protein